jgi:hypothetical protein
MAASMRAIAGAVARWFFVQPFGLSDRPGRDGALTTATVLVVAVSRWWAFPASIWDRDEAIFAQAIVDFAPENLVPHPPFFPLWVGLGRAVHYMNPSMEPELTLQLISTVFSVWIVFPLVALASLLMDRRQAVAAAMLFVSVPAAWMFSGRAFSETMATALLIGAAAHLLQPKPTTNSSVAGAAYLTASLLGRPQLLPVGIALCVWHTMRASNHRTRLIPWAIPIAVGLPVALFFVFRCGGYDATLVLLRNHAVYHFGKYGSFDWSAAELGVLNAAGGVLPGLIWLVLALEGFVLLLCRDKYRATALGLLLAVALPTIYYTVFAHNPTFLRYTLPWYAVTAPAVVAAITAMVGSASRGMIALTVVIVAISSQTAPHLGSYRSSPSPIVSALNEISDLEYPGQAHLLVDHNLSTFVDLYRTTGRIHSEVTWMPQRPRPFEQRTFSTDRMLAVAVFDDHLRRWDVSGASTSVHECVDTWLCSMASPRFHRVVVVYGGGGS